MQKYELSKENEYSYHPLDVRSVCGHTPVSVPEIPFHVDRETGNENVKSFVKLV